MHPIGQIVAALVTAITVAGCAPPLAGSGPGGSEPRREESLGLAFTLRPGERAVISGEALALTFQRVLEDSRCPSGVQCIWQGNAKVGIAVEKEAGGAVVLELNTAHGPPEAAHAGYKVQLLGLAPYRKHGAALEAADYQAEFRVIKAERVGAASGA